MNLLQIAVFRSPLREKFGIPRQSGLAPSLKGRIEFCEGWRDGNAIRGLDGFDMLWIIWGFSGNRKPFEGATVRPPRLGGNAAVGVFATRSPYRPNPIGLSAVKIEKIDLDGPTGPVIHVSGADLMDGTPIYDIKPYVVYADSFPAARSGFVDANPWKQLQVILSQELAAKLGSQDASALTEILSQDPRPQYSSGNREYGLSYGRWNVRFTVGEGVLTVLSVTPAAQ